MSLPPPSPSRSARDFHSTSSIHHQQQQQPVMDRWESPADLNLFVDDLVDQMNAEFQTMGDAILGRMNEVGARLESLEESIATVAGQAGLPVLRQQHTPATTRIIATPTKSKQQAGSGGGSPARQMVIAAPPVSSPPTKQQGTSSKISVEV